MKNEIAKLLGEIKPGQHIYNTFFDWVTMMAYSISNAVTMETNPVFKEREERYKAIAEAYTEDELLKFAECLAYLTEELGETPYDLLGEIYHIISANNKMTGQFFTPGSLSKLTAELALCNVTKREKYFLKEPSSGAGAMILAFAKKLKDKGINYCLDLEVVANDIDWNCVYMCYVQLSLAGIKATVYQNDTLKNEAPSPSQIFYTPARMFF